MSNKQFDPPIAIDAGGDPGTVTFTCLEDVSRWAQKETEAWAPLENGNVPPAFRARVKEQFQAGSAIATLASQCFSDDPAANQNARAKLEKQLCRYKTCAYTHHATSWGQSVLQLWSKSPVQASIALWAKGQLAAEAAGGGQHWLQDAHIQAHGALVVEAIERVVMAQTFLALYQDKKLTDDERKLVLASLFRPHSAPSDSDAPAGLGDLVSEAISPQKPQNDFAHRTIAPTARESSQRIARGHGSPRRRQKPVQGRLSAVLHRRRLPATPEGLRLLAGAY